METLVYTYLPIDAEICSQFVKSLMEIYANAAYAYANIYSGCNKRSAVLF